MPLPEALVGVDVAPMVHSVDERWTMAYAAALDDYQPCYLDTERPGGVVAHPMFSVCLEWPVIVSQRFASEHLGVSHDEVLTGIHATHDVTIERLAKPGDILTTSLDIVGLVSIKPGAKSTARLITTDEDGKLVATTTQDAINLGVQCEGADQPDPAPPATVAGAARRGDPVEIAIELSRGAAHIYTECARIWNPIHTDAMVARAAGLPDIILHGTANLAHGVSAVVDQIAPGQPELVRRIVCRFAAMVQLPSTITVRVWPANDTPDGRSTVPFEVVNADGAPAVENGLIVFGDELGGVRPPCPPPPTAAASDST